jgi:hypothetical protein
VLVAEADLAVDARVPLQQFNGHAVVGVTDRSKVRPAGIFIATTDA